MYNLCRALPCCATQDIFNLLPNANVDALSGSLAVKGNDMMAAIYLAALIRSCLALHRLIDNKEQRIWAVRLRARICVCMCARARCAVGESTNRARQATAVHVPSMRYVYSLRHHAGEGSS
jgi:hypothetical protein